MQDCSFNLNVTVVTHTENMVHVFNRSISWVTSEKIIKRGLHTLFKRPLSFAIPKKIRSPLTCVSNSLVMGPHYLGNGD